MLEAGVEGSRWLAEQLRKPAPDYGLYNIVGTHNQDRPLVTTELPLNKFGIQSVYGIIDGHGNKGELAAEHIVRRMPEIIGDRNLAPISNPLIEAYHTTHQEVVERFGNSPGAVGVILAGVEQGTESYWSGLYVGDPTILVRPPEEGIWRWPNGIDQQEARFTRVEHRLHKEQIALRQRKRWVAMRNCWGHADLDDIVNRSPKSFIMPRDWDIILASDSVGERLQYVSQHTGLSLDELVQNLIGGYTISLSKARIIAEFTRREEDERVSREKLMVESKQRDSVHGQDDVTVIYLPKK